MPSKNKPIGQASLWTRAATRYGLVVIIVMFIYITSFFITRRAIVLDFISIDSNGSGTSLVIYYFSESQKTNAALFYLYYPIHILLGHGDEQLINRAEKKLAVPHNSTVYVRDLRALASRQIGRFGRL